MATAGGTLTAGGDIRVNGALHEDVNVTAFAGAGGFVGLGASVVVISDASTVQAGIASNTDVISAASLSVAATTDQHIHGEATQVGIGAVAVGAAFVQISVDNDAATDTRASIGSNVDIGQAGTVGSVSVTATSTIVAEASTHALAAGVGTMSANFAFVDVTPEVEASIGAGSHVTVTGGVQVQATATPSARARTFGFALSVAIAAGASIADVESSPVVTAFVSGTIQAASLLVSARQLVPSGGYTALAETRGSSGSLVALNATVSLATDNAHVASYVADGSTLTITSTTNVAALNNSKQKADASANTGGVVALGISHANASSDTTTEAYLGRNVKLTGRRLVITATGTDDNFADVVAGSAGLVAGASASAETHSTSTTDARIKDRTGADTRNIDLSGAGVGELDIKAEHTSAFNARTQALTGGLFAGLGASTDNWVDAHVTAAIGDAAIVTAKDIDIEAVNHTFKDFLDTPNIRGKSGGAIAGGGADSHSSIALTTLVDIGDNARLSLVGNAGSPGAFILKSLNDIFAKDSVAFTAGGALAGLSANSTVETTADLSRVQIGAGAFLTSIGQIDIFARGQGDVAAKVEAQAYGVGTYTGALAKAKVYPHNEIEVADGATIHAKRDLNLYAGTGANFVRDHYAMDARSDTLAGSIFPLSAVNSTTAKITFNTITIDEGALLETAGEARLQAEKEGFADLTGSAKATSWVSAVQDWLNGAAAAAMNDATIFQEGHGIVDMNGTVRTGIERHKELILTGWDNAAGTITSYTQQGGVTFTSGPELVESGLAQELAFAQSQLNLYGDTNPTLKTFYTGEVARNARSLPATSRNSCSPMRARPVVRSQRPNCFCARSKPSRHMAYPTARWRSASTPSTSTSIRSARRPVASTCAPTSFRAAAPSTPPAMPPSTSRTTRRRS